jgi:hypothetical protein
MAACPGAICAFWQAAKKLEQPNQENGWLILCKK